MSTHDPNADEITAAYRAIWHAKAIGQGLVCVICGRVPRLERRPEFFDTGLCAACDTELGECKPGSVAY